MFMYLGAIKELYKNRDKFDIVNLRIYGSSAGSLMGLICLLVFNDLIDIDVITRANNDFFRTKTNLALLCVARLSVDYLDMLLEHIKPHELEIIKLTNRHLYIAASQPSKLTFIHKFVNISELYHCIILSSNLILLSSYPAYYKNEIAIDGGYRMQMSDLPRKCLKIYNYGYQFPECLYIPPNEKQSELIRSGKHFIKDIFKKTDVFYDALEDWCFYDYSEQFLAFVFLMQSISFKDYTWSDRIISIDK